MIDFFGRKARAELAAERAHNKALLAENIRVTTAAEFRMRELADIIRENDLLIWNMSQRTSWPEQRPFFNDLQTGMEARKTAESNRINDIMRKELIGVYHK